VSECPLGAPQLLVVRQESKAAVSRLAGTRRGCEYL